VSRTPCVFCEIVAGRAEANWVVAPDEWADAVAFVPLNPVVEGHTLIVPKVHVQDFATDPDVSAATMRRAAELMRWTDQPMNVITSRGREATQSVFHLHLHLVPRAENDGLALPWYSGKHRRRIAGGAS
jgi:histidine triad (HIT) family protein